MPTWTATFGYLGGTYPFWAEKRTPFRGPMSLPPATIHGRTVQGMAFQHDQKGGGIVGVVPLQIEVGRDDRVSKIKVLSGDSDFVEDATR